MFITFEGGEGAGKSTQLKKLADTLTKQGHQILTTREPGGAPNSEILRKILLAPENDWSPEAETLLHFAARAEHIAKTIQPALKAGKLVLCDRFYDSTRAYQAAGQGADAQLIETLINLLPVKPDLTLILDVTQATARARLIRRDTTADRYERLPPAFHARVAEAFRHIAATDPARCRLIDANPDHETVAASILAAVEARLQTKSP
jgi:dTMP kinase